MRTLLVTAKIKGCESYVADGELLGSCGMISICPRARR